MSFKNFHKRVGVQVFLEGRRRRHYVGLLTKENEEFCFEYDLNYLKGVYAIPLGPEMPMTRKSFRSRSLFIPFLDRIPSRENPAYPDYCRATGIAVDETDPFILLTTIARRGPSSFIFEPFYEDTFTPSDLLSYRKSLHLSVREFALCFDFSPSAITRIEKGQSSGRDILKRVEIYACYPTIALDQLRFHGHHLHATKFKRVEESLQKQLS